MTITIRCPHCHRYFGAPDLQSVKTYAAQGGLIQTLTERITAQPIHKHYITPGPFWLAAAVAGVPMGLSGALIKYAEFDPVVVLGFATLCFSVGLVIASTRIEETEVPDEPADDDEPEVEPAPARETLTEVSHPFVNQTIIRRAPHEPPRADDNNPKTQIRLGRADLALAKLVTASAYPMRPISWREAQRRRWGSNGAVYGEKTFYKIVAHWKAEGLVFSTNRGEVYLKPSGQRTLTQYAAQ